jgi:hypothetical protein
MAFLFNKAALAGSISDGVVLERTLPAFVANRAVEWVVDEEILENTFLCLLDDGGLSVNDHPVAHRRCAGWDQHLAAGSLDLDETHPAQAGGLHPWVPAEPGDVVAVVFSNLDEDFACGTLHLDAVNGDSDQLFLSQLPPPR